MSEQTGRNLHQRLLEVASQVGKVEASGSNQFKAKAMSIGDVEDELREKLAEAGVITNWSTVSLEDIGSGKLWQHRVLVTLINVDAPTDTMSAESEDIGGNPTAAASFAVKAYYRHLFHLSLDDEEKPHGDVQTTRQARPAASPSAPPANRGAIANDAMDNTIRQLVREVATAEDVAQVEIIAETKQHVGAASLLDATPPQKQLAQTYLATRLADAKRAVS